jgi:hypothetical protein
VLKPAVRQVVEWNRPIRSFVPNDSRAIASSHSSAQNDAAPKASRAAVPMSIILVCRCSRSQNSARLRSREKTSKITGNPSPPTMIRPQITRLIDTRPASGTRF